MSHRLGLRRGDRVRGYDVMGLLVAWMLAATRRGAGVFGGFVGVFYLLLTDWALWGPPCVAFGGAFAFALPGAHWLLEFIRMLFIH